MHPTEKKLQFVELRSSGMSYRDIGKKLGVNPKALVDWHGEFKQEIANLKKEKLNELYNNYYMTREARIKSLGETLKKVDNEIEKIDFEEVPPEKLLELKLKYTQALKAEYLPTSDAHRMGNVVNAQQMMMAFCDLLSRLQLGEISQDQATKEQSILTSIFNTEIGIKVEALTKTIEQVKDANNS